MFASSSRGRFLCAAGIVIFFWQAACKPMGGSSATGVAPYSEGPKGAVEPAASVFDRPTQRYSVEFVVHRITAPQGTFSTDDGVWKIAAEPAVQARTALRLTANGIRAAVGRESDRAGLLAHLEHLRDPKVALDHALPDVNRMVDLELGPCAQRLAVFYFDEAGEIHGCDFVSAVARFKMTYEMRLAGLGELILEIAPEIEEPAGPRKWVINAQGLPEEQETRNRTAFAELAFEARVQPGGFLLLGPTKAVYDRPLLARALFLQEESDGTGGSTPRYRESIYVISPIVRTSIGTPAFQVKAPG